MVRSAADSVTLPTARVRVMAYIELAKPERTLVNVITVLSGFLLACKWHVDFGLLAATLIGTSLVIGSSCVANNYFDRFIDEKMTRTKKRAIVTGSVSTSSAIVFAIVLGIVGFGILILFVNSLVVLLGAIAYLDYVVLYGLSKRRSKYGALVGTVSGSMSIVAGYCAVTGRIDTAAVILFLIMFFWQMPHFYAIAIYRIKDYIAAGIPVLPVASGVASAKRHILAYTVGFIIAGLALALFGYEDVTYSIVILFVGLAWLRLAAKGFRAKDDEAWARRMFSFSLIVNLVLAAIIPLGVLLP